MLNKIDKLSKTEFTEVFGNIFENASWIAEKLYLQKPFKNFQNLSNEMISIFENANNQNKLKILNSHPDLADKAKIGSLTLDSNNEQNDAGLNQCTEKEFNDFKNLNLEYKNKFGFPFIIAVKGKNRSEILLDFKKRILSSEKIEFDEAITQVKKIASARLHRLKIKFL
ncbi:2-oxo-4-hydroxy-4-carboxy-5-ureidoimidazoline decarboxylase [Pelagibacteraceae bacterium]|jgi:OHCU decarboxylase|nr:2-oxo-4-hydroxy-4-carboxy-5-ureidoimidazoline decarboxylase [Pelagibacteraceae bacterium]